ncbi:MAG: hypothetical protein ACREPW_00200 [Candidatus Binataceae bacterium]
MERPAEAAGAIRHSLRAAPIALFSMFLAMFLITACQALVRQQQATVQAEHKVSVEQDRLRLIVSTSDLTEPYEKLGDLSYTDPLNGETIDTDHINEKLRSMAIERWGQQADAIIRVTTRIGGTDTATISVTGEAVRMKGPCSGCRHNFSPPA